MGENIHIQDLRALAGDLSLDDIVLGENNNTKWNGDHGHRSYIGNLNWFTSQARDHLLSITNNPCAVEGDLLR